MSDKVSVFAGAGDYSIASGGSPLGEGLVRETCYYSPEGATPQVVFYCDHTNGSEITYFRILAGSNNIFTWGSLPS